MDALNIRARETCSAAVAALVAAGMPQLLARIYAGRGITQGTELETALKGLPPPEAMLNTGAAAKILADAIAAGKKLVIVADYDADGATSCALGVRALRAFGAQVDFIVPNRFEYGYGLTPEIVDLTVREKHPDIIITVDNGIASIEGVARAQELGVPVLVTDHHLPGDHLPAALCIVNPNQPGDGFPSKNIAGIGVMFYCMLALRAELRARGCYELGGEPNLSSLLDLVALGTVADVVRLDRTNRILVEQGLKRIRAGAACPGINALLRVGGRRAEKIGSTDLGFVLGPRLNAAGRMADMSAGIECLITDNEIRASELSSQLDRLNKERREVEADMQQDALAIIGPEEQTDQFTICMFDKGWHQGVIGILASRIKEAKSRPTIAFARGAPGEIKGSARSIPALHMRDALDLVAKRNPGLILRFGGHAAAAGLTIHEEDLPTFRGAFEASVREFLSAADLDAVIETDGALEPGEFTLGIAGLLQEGVWGQGFPQPTFSGEFRVDSQRIVGGKHLKLKLSSTDGGRPIEAMLFGQSGTISAKIRAVYRLDINEYQGNKTLQLIISHWEKAK